MYGVFVWGGGVGEEHVPDKPALEINLCCDAVGFGGPVDDFQRFARDVGGPLMQACKLIFKKRSTRRFIVAADKRAVDYEGCYEFYDREELL